MRFLPTIMIFILIFYYKSFTNSNKDLEELRVLFYSSVEDDNIMPRFKNKLLNIFGEYNAKINNPLGTAYWGIYRTLIAKHSFNPYTKLKELQKGLEIMEEAIKKDGNNLEIRFLRFSVLHHIPDFLGYKNEKTDDARKIAELLINKDYTSLGFQFQKGIAEFIIKSQRIDKNNIQKLTDIYLK